MDNEVRFKRERRKTIVFCDDVDCFFKRTCRGIDGLKGECSLDLDRAIKFYKKYGITTCEAGMGDKRICKSSAEQKRVLTYYKLSKYKYKGSEKNDM